MTKTWIKCGILIIFALTLAGATRAEDGGARGVGTATGLPLPRFVSLKADEVNARVGPGGDYQIAWVFRRAGLPVEAVAEFENWRQVRDASGSTGWVNAGPTSARRTAVVAPWTKTARFLSSPRHGAAPRRWRGSNPARSSMSCIATARTARFTPGARKAGCRRRICGAFIPAKK